jgi:hypothetical protein
VAPPFLKSQPTLDYRQLASLHFGQFRRTKKAKVTLCSEPLVVFSSFPSRIPRAAPTTTPSVRPQQPPREESKGASLSRVERHPPPAPVNKATPGNRPCCYPARSATATASPLAQRQRIRPPSTLIRSSSSQPASIRFSRLNPPVAVSNPEVRITPLAATPIIFRGANRFHFTFPPSNTDGLMQLQVSRTVVVTAVAVAVPTQLPPPVHHHLLLCDFSPSTRRRRLSPPTSCHLPNGTACVSRRDRGRPHSPCLLPHAAAGSCGSPHLWVLNLLRFSVAPGSS